MSRNGNGTGPHAVPESIDVVDKTARYVVRPIKLWLGLVVSLLVAGWAAAEVVLARPTRHEVEQLVDPLKIVQDDLQRRVTGLESELRARMSDVERGLERIERNLFRMASAAGVPATPPPAPTQGATP
jgi:hypothetical protein